MHVCCLLSVVRSHRVAAGASRGVMGNRSPLSQGSLLFVSQLLSLCLREALCVTCVAPFSFPLHAAAMAVPSALHTMQCSLVHRSMKLTLTLAMAEPASNGFLAHAWRVCIVVCLLVLYPCMCSCCCF